MLSLKDAAVLEGKGPDPACAREARDSLTSGPMGGGLLEPLD